MEFFQIDQILFNLKFLRMFFDIIKFYKKCDDQI